MKIDNTKPLIWILGACIQVSQSYSQAYQAHIFLKQEQILRETYF